MSPLEDRKIAFNRVLMHVDADPFVSFMVDAFMTVKVIAQREISTGFVHHHHGFFGNVFYDAWNKRRRADTIDVKRADLLAPAVNKGKHSVFVAVTPAHLKRRNSSIATFSNRPPS